MRTASRSIVSLVLTSCAFTCVAACAEPQGSGRDVTATLASSDAGNPSMGNPATGRPNMGNPSASAPSAAQTGGAADSADAGRSGPVASSTPAPSTTPPSLQPSAQASTTAVVHPQPIADNTVPEAGTVVTDAGAQSSSPTGAEAAARLDASDPEVVRPLLVTSAEGDYWREATPTQVPAAESNISVSPDTARQRWDGFGGSFEERGWAALSQLSEAERERALRLLFDAADGAKFTWGRLPIGASEYALERYSYNDVADDYGMDNFTIARDREHLIPYLESALSFNPELRLFAIPWSPPAWMKDNLQMDRGALADRSDVLMSYALYLARYVEAYAEAGFNIEAVHAQNSPTLVDDVPSCQWSAELLTRFVRDYLAPRFAERGLSTEIWLGELDLSEDDALVSELMSDIVAAQFISGLSLAWDTTELIEEMALWKEVPAMHARHEPGNAPWLVDFQAEGAPNDHAYAIESWQQLHLWIKAGVNSYLAWNMVLDDYGVGLNEVTLWPKNALLVVDRETQALTVTPAYYVFRHLSYFVDPGAVRLEATSVDFETLAFRNPDDSIVSVVFNSATEAREATVGIGGERLQFSVPAQGWATLNWR